MLRSLLLLAMANAQNAAVPPALNWSHFPHFSWRARVTGISDGRPVPNTTHFTVAGNTTSANGSAWSPPMVFDNASVARAAGSYTNSVLLAGKGSYDELAGDKFDLLNFGLNAGDAPHAGQSGDGSRPQYSRADFPRRSRSSALHSAWDLQLSHASTPRTCHPSLIPACAADAYGWA